MGMIDLKQAVVQCKDGTNHSIKLFDFHQVNTATDPMKRHHMVFLSYADRIKKFPTVVRPRSLPPVHMHQALRYLDARQWTAAYDAALHKLDSEAVVDFNQPLLLGAKPLPLTVSFFQVGK